MDRIGKLVEIDRKFVITQAKLLDFSLWLFSVFLGRDALEQLPPVPRD